MPAPATQYPENLQVKVATGTSAALREAARQRGITMSELVRQKLREEIFFSQCVDAGVMDSPTDAHADAAD